MEPKQPRSEVLFREILKEVEFSTIRWLLEVANQEYNGRSVELRNEIDQENALNRWQYPKKNLMEMRKIWN